MSASPNLLQEWEAEMEPVDELIIRFTQNVKRLARADEPGESFERGFLHLLDQTFTQAFAMGEQIEPMRTLAHKIVPLTINYFEIESAEVYGRLSLATHASNATQERAGREIRFDIVPDPDIDNFILRTGHLLLPREDGISACRYEEESQGAMESFRFAQANRLWPTIDDAVRDLRADKMLQSMVIARSPHEYTIRRTILPLFAMRYPQLTGPWVPEE